jgi:uncharacterized protein YaiE (UPF0345 family)
MDEFRNVTVVKKANIYFDGKVTSRIIRLADGTRKTLGIMMPGEYEFNTASTELMEILGGQMDVILPGETQWQTFKEGQSFKVPASSKFRLKVPVVADYCCSYLK